MKNIPKVIVSELIFIFLIFLQRSVLHATPIGVPITSGLQVKPRPITEVERMNLLKMIKEDDDEAIKTFFTAKENQKIDFPLITFKSTDDPVDDSAPHGFTPLSAAIY